MTARADVDFPGAYRTDDLWTAADLGVALGVLLAAIVAGHTALRRGLYAWFAYIWLVEIVKDVEQRYVASPDFAFNFHLGSAESAPYGDTSVSSGVVLVAFLLGAVLSWSLARSGVPGPVLGAVLGPFLLYVIHTVIFEHMGSYEQGSQRGGWLVLTLLTAVTGAAGAALGRRWQKPRRVAASGAGDHPAGSAPLPLTLPDAVAPGTVAVRTMVAAAVLTGGQLALAVRHSGTSLDAARSTERFAESFREFVLPYQADLALWSIVVGMTVVVLFSGVTAPRTWRQLTPVLGSTVLGACAALVAVGAWRQWADPPPSRLEEVFWTAGGHGVWLGTLASIAVLGAPALRRGLAVWIGWIYLVEVVNALTTSGMAPVFLRPGQPVFLGLEPAGWQSLLVPLLVGGIVVWWSRRSGQRDVVLGAVSGPCLFLAVSLASAAVVHQWRTQAAISYWITVVFAIAVASVLVILPVQWLRGIRDPRTRMSGTG